MSADYTTVKVIPQGADAKKLARLRALDKRLEERIGALMSERVDVQERIADVLRKWSAR